MQNFTEEIIRIVNNEWKGDRNEGCSRVAGTNMEVEAINEAMKGTLESEGTYDSSPVYSVTRIPSLPLRAFRVIIRSILR
mgnify:CR=1 FL=1